MNILRFIDFTFGVKIILILASLFCAILIVLIGKPPFTYIFHLVVWILWIIAVLPSVIGLLPEVFAQIAYGLCKFFRKIICRWSEIQPDKNTALAFKRLVKRMGSKEELRLEIMPNFYNAQMKGKTVYFGKPVLDILGKSNTRALIAHEIAHNLRNHSVKIFLPMVITILVVTYIVSALTGIVISPVQFLKDASGPDILSFIEFFVLAFSLLMPLFSWVAEFDADSSATKCVDKTVMKATLQRMAVIRRTDISRDFYLHPSILKRLANLNRSVLPRIVRWYLGLCSPKLPKPLP